MALFGDHFSRVPFATAELAGAALSSTTSFVLSFGLRAGLRWLLSLIGLLFILGCFVNNPLSVVLPHQLFPLFRAVVEVASAFSGGSPAVGAKVTPHFLSGSFLLSGQGSSAHWWRPFLLAALGSAFAFSSAFAASASLFSFISALAAFASLSAFISAFARWGLLPILLVAPLLIGAGLPGLVRLFAFPGSLTCSACVVLDC